MVLQLIDDGEETLEDLVKTVTDNDKKQKIQQLLRGRKLITNKYDKLYLNWLLFKIYDLNLHGTNEYRQSFMNKLTYLEDKGYFIDEWLLKYKRSISGI